MSSSRRNGRTWPWAVSILLLLCALCGPVFVRAMIDRDQTVHCSSGDDFFATWSFEFAAGGSYSLDLSLAPSESVTVRNRTVQILLATDAQLSPIRSATMEDVCKSSDFNYSPVTWVARLGAGMSLDASVQLSLPTKDWLRLLVLNCDADSFTMHYSSVAMNPGGEYLSLSQVPFKKVYAVFLWVWAGCVAAWAAHLWLYRHWNIALQCLLVLLPLSKGILCGPSELYWRQASSTGFYPRAMAWGVMLVQVFDRCVWVVVVYMVAAGWRLTKPALLAQQKRALGVIVSFLCVAYLVFEIWGGFLVFLLLVSYVLVLRLVFAALLENGNALIRQKHVLTSADIDWTRTPLHAKLGMFKYLQVMLVAFISIDVIFHLWAAIFLKDQPWVSDCAEHVLSALLCIALGIAFRMRPFNPFFLPIFTALIEANANAAEEGAPPPVAAVPSVVAVQGNQSVARSGAAMGRVHSPAVRGAAGDEYHVLADHAAPHHAADMDDRSPDLVLASRVEGSDGDHVRGGAGARGASGRLWGGAPTDQLWRPGCPVPPRECCVPAAFGAERGVGGARHARSAAPIEPVLVLESDPSSDHPTMMIGVPVARGHGGGGASALDMDSYSAAWSSLPPAALPYLPPAIRAHLDAQRQLLQHDQRRALPLSSVRRTAASDARAERSQRSRRHDSFPDYI